MSYKIEVPEFENTVTYLAAGEDVNPSAASIKSGQHHYIMAGNATLTLPSLGSKSVEFVLTHRGEVGLSGSQEDANIDIVGSNIFEYGLDTPQGYSSATNLIKIKPYSARTFLHWNGFWYEKYNPNAALPEVFEISGTDANTYNTTNDTDNYKSEAVYRLNPTQQNTSFYLSQISNLSGLGFKYYVKNVSSFNITILCIGGGLIDTSYPYTLSGGQSVVLIATGPTQWIIA